MPNICVQNNGTEIFIPNNNNDLNISSYSTSTSLNNYYIISTSDVRTITTPTTTNTTSLYYTVNSTTATTSSIIIPHNGFFYYTDTGYINGSRSHIYETLKAKKGPLIAKSIRNSIKRALKLISNFGMEEDLKIFLGGDSIEVSHPDSDFKFLLSKKENMLLRATEHCGHHTPYNLDLYTKSDIFISSLCVYMDKTPILDQILALSMFIKTGNEQDLLSKANYNRLTPNIELRKQLALSNPYLEKKLKADFINI